MWRVLIIFRSLKTGLVESCVGDEKLFEKLYGKGLLSNLDLIGKEGWELVTVVPAASDKKSDRYFFKKYEEVS